MREFGVPGMAVAVVKDGEVRPDARASG